MHLNEGQLRAHLDGELDPTGERHLAACRECQARQAEVAQRARRIGQHLAGLPEAEAAPAARAAYARFLNRYPSSTESEAMSMNTLRSRPALAIAALIVVLGISLAFPPVRAWAGEFLGLFRVQQVAILPVDTTGLSEIGGDETLARQVSQLMSDSVTVLQEPGPPQAAADAAEAGRLAGFQLRLPETAGASALYVSGATAFEMTINLSQAQAFLNDLGRSDLQLPDSLDGARLAVNIPAGVTAAFGDCPSLDRPEADDLDFAPRRCTLLAQFPSPTVDAPPDLDVEALALIGLQLAGLSEAEARDFSDTADWTSTLVIPLPQQGLSYDPIVVDGVTGYQIVRRPEEGEPTGYEIIWVRDGIIYAVTGYDKPATGLALANSLR